MRKGQYVAFLCIVIDKNYTIEGTSDQPVTRPTVSLPEVSITKYDGYVAPNYVLSQVLIFGMTMQVLTGTNMKDLGFNLRLGPISVPLVIER